MCKKNWSNITIIICKCIISDQFRDLLGHTLKIVAVAWFPYVDFHLDNGISGSNITLRDSIDTRIIETLASKLNFTYVLHDKML